MILDVFFRLLAGHLVGDFVLQPLWLAIAKRRGWRGLLIHVTVVTVTTATIVAGKMPHWFGWMVTLFGIHLFIDQFRTFVFTNNSKGRGVLLLIADQLVHVGSLVLISGWATGEPMSALSAIFTAPPILSNYQFFAFSLVVVTFWVAPIFEIETIVAIASFRGNANKGVAPILLSDRLMGGTERTLALVAIATGYWLFAPLLFVPRWLWLRKNPALQKWHLAAKMGVSVSITLLMGLLLTQVHFF